MKSLGSFGTVEECVSHFSENTLELTLMSISELCKEIKKLKERVKFLEEEAKPKSQPTPRPYKQKSKPAPLPRKHNKAQDSPPSPWYEKPPPAPLMAIYTCWRPTKTNAPTQPKKGKKSLSTQPRPKTPASPEITKASSTRPPTPSKLRPTAPPFKPPAHFSVPPPVFFQPPPTFSKPPPVFSQPPPPKVFPKPPCTRSKAIPIVPPSVLSQPQTLKVPSEPKCILSQTIPIPDSTVCLVPTKSKPSPHPKSAPPTIPTDSQTRPPAPPLVATPEDQPCLVTSAEPGQPGHHPPDPSSLVEDRLWSLVEARLQRSLGL